jgi:L-threonylcarbamoyladenylate synthase
VTFEYVDTDDRTGLLRLADVERIGTALSAGGLAVLPTETGYMLAAVATCADAVTAAFRVKGRSQANVMHIACSSLEMARRFAVIEPMAETFIGQLTPGPLSVVVPQTDRLPASLVTLNGTVGIRVPDNAATLQVIAAVGTPLTATSLNLAGQASTSIEAEDLSRLDWPGGATVFVVVDPKAVVYSAPSTLVRLTEDQVEILRPGPVTEDVLRQHLAAPPA